MLEKDKQDQIEQVYHELTKHKVLPGAKVYEIIGKELPKYDFEK
ncbi:MAG: hypothetical protein ACXWL2_04575 [Candidatus Chromulinivorax sp.]